MVLPLIVSASRWAMPLFIFLILVHAIYKKVRVFDAFVEGGKEGFQMAVKLLPYMVGLFTAINIFRESGAMELLTNLFGPIFKYFGVPSEVIPVAIARPLSGVAALALTVDIFDKFGPDSFIGRLASAIDGSTDTTLYIIAVYFASVGVKKARHSVIVGLCADLMGFIAAVYVTHLVFA